MIRDPVIGAVRFLAVSCKLCEEVGRSQSVLSERSEASGYRAKAHPGLQSGLRLRLPHHWIVNDGLVCSGSNEYAPVSLHVFASMGTWSGQV